MKGGGPACLLFLAAVGCRHASLEHDPALLLAIERLDSPSVEEREAASEILTRAPNSVLPFLEKLIETASCHEVEYRALRAADSILVRDRVRIVPEIVRENSKGGGEYQRLVFNYDVSTPMAGIGDFRVEVLEALDETAKPVSVERTVDFLWMANTLDVEALRSEIMWRIRHPYYFVGGGDHRIATIRGTLRFSGRTGETTLPFALGGLVLRCRFVTPSSGQRN